jgi:hypothetical protein
MTFLNILFLFALFAAAIPIIIHLLNLHRIRTVDFSTLRFLKQVQRKQMKKLQLKRWWLLLLRVLIVLLLVLTFARPALRSTVAVVGAHEQTAAVLLIDNSASSLIDDNMYHIKERCYEVLDELRDGDEITIVPLQGGLTAGLQTRQRELAHRFIGDLEPTPLTPQPLDVFEEAIQLLVQSKDLNRELYFCSDFAWEFTEASIQDDLDYYSDIQLFLLPVTPADPANVAVTEVSSGERLPIAGQPLQLHITIANYGPALRERLIVQLYLEGERVAEQSVSIPAGTEVNLDIDINSRLTGYLNGYVEIDDRVLHWDDRHYFSLHIPDVYRIALIGDNSKTNTILAAALVPDSTRVGRIDLEVISTAAAQSRSLEMYDTIILNSVQPSEAAFRRVQTAMNSGTGIVYFPDCDRDAAVSAALASKYLGLPPFAGVTESSDLNRAFVTLGEIDRQHPLLAPLFERYEQLDSPRLKRYCRYRKTSDVTSLLTLENGDIFAGLYQQGDSQGLFFTVPLSATASDFFRKGLYAPLVNRAVEWVATGRKGTTISAVAGECITMEFPFHASQWRLQTDTQTLYPEVTNRMDGDWLITPSSLDPGNYAVIGEGRSAGVLTVNINPLEGDIRTECSDEWKSVLQQGAQIVYQGEELAPVVGAARHGQEMWRYALAGALLLLLIEGTVSRRK